MRSQRICVVAAIFVLLTAVLASPARSQEKAEAEALSTSQLYQLVVIVHDENGSVIPMATLSLDPPSGQTPRRGTTDPAGRVAFGGLAAGVARLTAEKEGYYAVTAAEIRIPESEPIEITLNHVQEYKETVHVVDSPETIDPARTAATQGLNSREVLELPYPTTRDIRNSLSLMPGVLPDRGGQVHINGSDVDQALYALDGFDVTHPFQQMNELRVSTDAVRGIEVQGSRTSAAYGRGSAGSLNVETGMGDDHFRFYATDFIPSLQQNHGLRFQNTTPRFSFSGPIEHGKAWFYEAVEGEYNQDIFSELPAGANTDYFWRFSNLLRAQVNLSPGNRLTGSFVVNRSRDDFSGLSIVQPLSTTTTDTSSAYLATLKDQASWANGMLLETGFGYIQFNDLERPLGIVPFIEIPGSALGNFYSTTSGDARRYQMFTHLYLPPARWHGRHQLLFGADLARTLDHEIAERRPFSIRTCLAPQSPPGCTAQNSTRLVRSVSFAGSPRFDENNFNPAGFLEDRWAVSDRLLLELGLRLEGDTLLSRSLFSPRLASTFLLTSDGQTKLSAGIGLYYDRTDMDLLARRLEGQRQDIFFAPNGITPLGPPVITQFQANPAVLQEPGFLNWSIGLERKLLKEVYLKTEFIEKRGMNGFDYQNVGGGIGASGLPASGLFVLRNDRENRYDAVTISLRHTFEHIYPVFIAYTRSAARTNTVLDSTLDDPFFGPQLRGPLPWDSPNRVLAWGWVPLVRGFTFGYTFDWRTGYPFSLTNDNQELVGLPDRNRFPDFGALNVHIEKQFHLFGFQWALRAGFNNVTGRKNPSVVDNNVNSPTFLTFGGFQHRAFTGRIRLLGRR